MEGRSIFRWGPEKGDEWGPLTMVNGGLRAQSADEKKDALGEMQIPGKVDLTPEKEARLRLVKEVKGKHYLPTRSTPLPSTSEKRL